MTDTLLGPNDPPPFYIENPEGRAPYFIVCDHASNRVPEKLGKLGVSDENMQKHIGWDIGAADVTKYLCEKLDARAIMANYSRLVIDLNRSIGHPGSMLPISDHIEVPGNQNIPGDQVQQRLNEIFHPYHREVERQINAFHDRGIVPVIISIHSFTEYMDGFDRPWEIGILWNKDDRVAPRLIENLRKNNPDLQIGDNEPYSIQEDNSYSNTIETHAEDCGLPSAIVEFRQDLISTLEGAIKWGDIFLESLVPILEDEELYKKRKTG